MDTSDSQIVFDENGVADNCSGFKKDVLPNWHKNNQGKAVGREMIERIGRSGAGQTHIECRECCV